jgi:putative phage-type endonuclease
MTAYTLDLPFIPDPAIPEREVWLEARREGIGGSDIAAIMGESPWLSALMVYHSKIDGTSACDDSERMLWGRRLEQIIAQETARRLGWELLHTPGIRRHPKNDRWIASIDNALNSPDGIVGLEVKTAGGEQRPSWDEGLPRHYYLQVQWYLMVTGWKSFIISVLFGGNTPRAYAIDPDEDCFASMAAAADAFWLLVESRTPPTATGLDLDLLATQHAESNGCLIPTTDELDAAADLYLQASAATKEWSRMKDDAGARIKQVLGDAEGTDDGRITWKPTKSGNRTLRVRPSQGDA